jgi:hypothetical protein
VSMIWQQVDELPLSPRTARRIEAQQIVDICLNGRMLKV